MQIGCMYVSCGFTVSDQRLTGTLSGGDIFKLYENDNTCSVVSRQVVCLAAQVLSSTVASAFRTPLAT